MEDNLTIAEEYLQRNLDLMLPSEDKDRNEEYLTAEWMK